LSEKHRVQQWECDAERAVERPPSHPLDDVEADRQRDDNRNVDEVESLERDADLVRIRIHEQRGDRPERKQEREEPQPAPPRAARNIGLIVILPGWRAWLVGTGSLRHHATDGMR